MTGMGLFAMSAKGEMAVVLDPQGFGRVEGTLARAALAGGPPRQLAESVVAADWRPDGSELAIVRSGNGKDVLEYPIGHTLYDPSPGHITHIRVSPRGDAVAMLDSPGVGRHRRRGGAGRSRGPGDDAVDAAGTACSVWRGRPTATRSGSPARAPARHRRCTR